MAETKQTPEQAAKTLFTHISLMKVSEEQKKLLDLARQAVGSRKDQIKAERRLYREIQKEMDAEPAGPVPTLKGYAAHELPSVKFEPRTPLLFRGDQVFFSSGQIGEVFATRGEGKTWFLLTIALLIAYGKSAMGFEARESRRVLYIDGEMARQDIVDRVVLLARVLNIDLTPSDLLSNLTIVAADWQSDPMPRIDTVEGKLAVAPFVQDADVIIIDNRSCLFDPEGEKDPTAWQPAGDYLLSLRRAGKTVLLAHHANRSGGARGIGKPEDAMDMIIRLKRPEDRPDAGAVFEVSVQPEDGGKARGLWGQAAVPFTVELTSTGWQIVVDDDESGTSKLIEERIRVYLQQAMSVNEAPKSMTQAVSRVVGKKEDKLAAFTAMVERGDVVKVDGCYVLAPSAKPEGGRRDDL